jgi:uncharacterized protein (DUF433 family)
MNYKKHISIDANIRFGKPIIIGTRISVYDVLTWLSKGLSSDDIIMDYPELNQEKINACIAFAANRERNIRVVA